MSMENDIVQEYMGKGMNYFQACSIAGVKPIDNIDSVRDDSSIEGMSDEELVELNGSLAIRAIHSALTSKKIDNTLIQAAIRAVQMLESQRLVVGTDDPEDDMLRWVAELNREKLNNG